MAQLDERPLFTKKVLIANDAALICVNESVTYL